jgi:hypothetical protein
MESVDLYFVQYIIVFLHPRGCVIKEAVPSVTLCHSKIVTVSHSETTGDFYRYTSRYLPEDMFFTVMSARTLNPVIRRCNYNQNQWVSGLCPSSGILNSYKTQRFGNWICSRLQASGGDTYLVGSLRKS